MEPLPNPESPETANSTTDKSALPDKFQKNESSPFEIRLESTYYALLFTNETIAITIAQELTRRLNEIISTNRGHEAISILNYDPKNPAYFIGKAKSYFLAHSGEPDSIRQALLPSYGLLRNHFRTPDDDKFAAWLNEVFLRPILTEEERKAFIDQQEVAEPYAKLHENIKEEPVPSRQEIEFTDGAFDILDYGSRFELFYDERDLENKENFAFFFAVRLGTETITLIDDFLTFHLVHNFARQVAKFTRFLELVCHNYEERVISSGRCELVKGWKPYEEILLNALAEVEDEKDKFPLASSFVDVDSILKCNSLTFSQLSRSQKA